MWPQLNSPLKKVGEPRETLVYDIKEGKEKAKPARLGVDRKFVEVPGGPGQGRRWGKGGHIEALRPRAVQQVGYGDR